MGRGARGTRPRGGTRRLGSGSGSDEWARGVRARRARLRVGTRMQQRAQDRRKKTVGRGTARRRYERSAARRVAGGGWRGALLSTAWSPGLRSPRRLCRAAGRFGAGRAGEVPLRVFGYLRSKTHTVQCLPRRESRAARDLVHVLSLAARAPSLRIPSFLRRVQLTRA